MTSQDLRLKLANESNRLNHEKALLQVIDEQWKEKKEFVQTLSGAVQTLMSLLREAEAAEKAGEAQANEFLKAMAEKDAAAKTVELKG
jgi:hypothetical protein